MNGKYYLFLKEVSLIQKKYEPQNEEFNIFTILRNGSDEVNVHSRFIAELLKNKKYGQKFQKLFYEELEKCSEKVISIMEDLNKCKTNVVMEYQTSDGRIDILIKISAFNFKKVIVIENKIYADDQDKQIQRYYDEMVKEGYEGDEIELVYLTLGGSLPSDISLGNLKKTKKEEIIKISYKDNIINWIENCLKEIFMIPVMRETIFQYKELLMELTNTVPKNELKEITEMVKNNKEYIRCLPLMIDVFLNLKIDSQLKFWQALERGIKEKKSNLERVEDNNYSEEKIRRYHMNLNNSKYYGMSYLIKNNFRNDENLYLRIEIGQTIYWGFFSKDKDGNNTSETSDSLKNELSKYNFTPSKWWLGCQSFSFNNKWIEFKNCDVELIEVLQDETDRNEFIDDIVKSIFVVYDKIISP